MGTKLNKVALVVLGIVLCMWVWSEYVRYGEHEDFRRTVTEFHQERMKLRLAERVRYLEEHQHECPK
jgi:hypothetical protein